MPHHGAVHAWFRWPPLHLRNGKISLPSADPDVHPHGNDIIICTEPASMIWILPFREKNPSPHRQYRVTSASFLRITRFRMEIDSVLLNTICISDKSGLNRRD